MLTTSNTIPTNLISDGETGLNYYPALFSHLELDALTDCIPFRQNSIFIFGKNYPEPRLTAWCGPPYTYSGIQWSRTEWIPELTLIKDKINALLNASFNAVLCNLYRSGQDGMGWHSDNEPEIDKSLIASVSLGQTRMFKVRSTISKETYSFELAHGSLLVMRNFQDTWQHSIPKSKKDMNPRLNLTFRCILPQNTR